MKKLYVFLIYLLVITVCLCSTTNAAETGTITKAEAQELVSKAYLFSNNVRSYQIKKPIYESGQSITVHLDTINEDVMYHKVIEENLPGGSYEAMCEYAKTIYCEEVAPLAYKYSAAYGTLDNPAVLINTAQTAFYAKGKHRPLFYTDTNGDLYTSVLDPQIGFSFALLDDNDDAKGIYTFNITNNISLKIVSGDANSAVAHVPYFYSKMEDIPPFDIQTVECKFVKTDNGWRIDESEFSVLASTSSKETLEAYRAAVNPSTADPNVSRVWWLAGVSIAAIVPAVCLLRRRRRED